MDQWVHERAGLERALARAVEEDLILPRFRPTLDLQTGTVVAFEVSPSWHGADAKKINAVQSATTYIALNF